jgi:hypothetical protein
MRTSASTSPRLAVAAAEYASAPEVRTQVEQLRRRLGHVRAGRAALAATAMAFTTVAATTLLATWLARRGTPMPLASLLPWLVGAVAWVGAFAAQRARFTPLTAERAALWLEEHEPRGHAIVTLVDPVADALPPDVAVRLARQAALPRPGAPVAANALALTRARVWRAPAIASAVALLAVVLVSLVSGTTVVRSRAGVATAGGRAAEQAAAVRASRLATWRVEVAPPAYARRPARSLDDVSTVEALPGSRVRVIGTGDADGLVAAWVARGGALGDAAPGDAAVSVAANDGKRWSVVVTMPARPAALRLTDRAVRADRALALVPRQDSLPAVTLLAPARDTVTRDSVGTIALAAEARDDLGLANARFELIVTSGAGERYTARTVVVGARALDGVARTTLAARVTFAELGLVPGDVVHLRAVARDRHPAAAREAGVSETRSLRIARSDEYDSVAVDAAPPPPVDSSLLSQRMLLLLTERLEARRPRLAREVVVRESRALAVEQARIRRAVSSIVFQRLGGEDAGEHVHSEGDGHDHGLVVQAGKLVPSTPSPAAVMPGATPPSSLAPPDPQGGESPIVGINRPLLEAYNHMWDAGRALELADPAAAIPPMRLALEAIQRARAAERVYLRGRTRPIVVDLARVRLAGRDSGQSSERRAIDAVPSVRGAYDARLLAAASRLATDPSAARDSLLVLRLDAIATQPAFAEAIEAALAALRAGRDATSSLVRARRTLAPPSRVDGLAAWSAP